MASCTLCFKHMILLFGPTTIYLPKLSFILLSCGVLVWTTPPTMLKVCDSIEKSNRLYYSQIVRSSRSYIIRKQHDCQRLLHPYLFHFGYSYKPHSYIVYFHFSTELLIVMLASRPFPTFSTPFSLVPDESQHDTSAGNLFLH